MMANAMRSRRRLFAAEVVQTSAMDCGPAALKCLLEGFGIHVSYGRLREACQTDVDGTSIDTLEEAAVQLGLEAEQVMVPVDHLLLPEAAALPALVVVRLASGFTHFVVAWRRHGRVVQVMDPATGRRWPTCKSFLNDVYVHTMPIPTAAWRAWAETPECLGTLRRRLAHLGVGGRVAARAMEVALAEPDWGLLAILDATARMVHAIVHAGGLRRGRQAAGVFEAFFERARQGGPDATQTIPEAYWTVRPAPPGPDGEAHLLVRGAVLVRVCGRRQRHPPPPAQAAAGDLGEPAPLSPELLAALAEPPRSPGRELVRLLRADGLLAPTGLVAALALAAVSVVVEVLLLAGSLTWSVSWGSLSSASVPWPRCSSLSPHCCSSSSPSLLACSAWGDTSKCGCARLFWRRSPVSTTVTSRAGRLQTWPSVATVCTSCACCRTSAGSSCGSSASSP